MKLKVITTVYDREKDLFYNYHEEIDGLMRTDFINSLKDGRFFNDPDNPEKLLWFPFHSISKITFP